MQTPLRSALPRAWLACLASGVLCSLLPGLGQAAPADLSIPTVAPQDSVLAEYVPEGAPDPNPPPYTLLRYNERYDWLADPKHRRDALDTLKYIRLNPDDAQSYLSLGGELRERYESVQHDGFGVDSGSNASYLLQRITLGADLHVNQRLRLFVQGISGLQWGQTETAPPVQQDPIDVQQGFVDYVFGTPSDNGPRLTTRFGRFEMSYGSGRLIATRAAPNIPFAFDGFEAIAAHGKARLYLFATHPVQEHKYRLDTEYGGQAFWGAYATRPLSTLSPLPLTLDGYYLGYRNRDAHYAAGSGTELRHSFGLRAWGKTSGLANTGAWDYDWEPVVQTGEFAGRQIFAWTLATDTGYTFSPLPWQPRLGFKADIASGDEGQAHGRFGGFDPLFFKAGYFNDASAIRPTNVADLHPSLQLVPARWLSLTAASDFLWRYSLADGVYGPSGNLELQPNGHSRYIGQTAETALQWKAGRHLSGGLSWVHLFASEAVQQSGGHDIDFLGAWGSFIW